MFSLESDEMTAFWPNDSSKINNIGQDLADHAVTLLWGHGLESVTECVLFIISFAIGNWVGTDQQFCPFQQKVE